MRKITLTLLFFGLSVCLAIAQANAPFEQPTFKYYDKIPKNEGILSICTDNYQKLTYIATTKGIYLIDSNKKTDSTSVLEGCKRILENNQITHIESIWDGVQSYVLVALSNGLVAELKEQDSMYYINISDANVCYDLKGFFERAENEKNKKETKADSMPVESPNDGFKNTIETDFKVNKIAYFKTTIDDFLLVATSTGLYCLYVKSKKHIPEESHYYDAIQQINSIATSITDIVDYPTAELDSKNSKKNKRSLSVSFTTDNGLFTLERGEYPKVIRALKGKTLLSITQDGTDFFIGGIHHIWGYEYSSIGGKIKWTKITKKLPEDSIRKIGFIKKILRDKDENLWLAGTTLGFIQKGFKSVHLYNNKDGFDANSPTCITIDCKGRILVGSLNGLYYVPKEYKKEAELKIKYVSFLKRGSKKTKSAKKIKRMRIEFEVPDNISERNIEFEIFYGDDGVRNVTFIPNINESNSDIIRFDYLPKGEKLCKGIYEIKAWLVHPKTRIREKPIQSVGNKKGSF